MAKLNKMVQDNKIPIKEAAKPVTLPVPPSVTAIRKSVKQLEAEAETKEKMHKQFERVIQFVNIMGQFDSFISDRTRNIIRKLNAWYDVDEMEKPKRNNRPSVILN